MSASVTRCLEQNVASILLKDAKFCRHIKKHFLNPKTSISNLLCLAILLGRKNYQSLQKIAKMVTNRQIWSLFESVLPGCAALLLQSRLAILKNCYNPASQYITFYCQINAPDEQAVVFTRSSSTVTVHQA